LDGRPHDSIWRGGDRRYHLGDEIGLAWITRLRQMDLIAHPMGVAFTAGAGLQVIGRLDEHRGWRALVHGAPAQFLQSWNHTAIVGLYPNLPQALQRWKRTPGERTCIVPAPVEKLSTLGTDPQGQGVALTGLWRQTPPGGPQAIAGGPLQRPPLSSSGGVGLTQLVERLMQSCQSTG